MRKRKNLFLLPSAFLLTGCDINISSKDFTDKLIPNWVSFVTQLGALIVLITVVIVFAYKPVKKILQKRQDYIEGNIKESEEREAKAKENELKSQEMIIESTKKADSIVAQAQKDALVEKDKIISDAAKEVAKMKRDAEQDIIKMEEEAKEEIKNEIVSVALDASKELLSREVTSEDNKNLIEDFIKDLDK